MNKEDHNSQAFNRYSPMQKKKKFDSGVTILNALDHHTNQNQIPFPPNLQI